MRSVLLLLFAAAIATTLAEDFSKEGKLNILNTHNEFRSTLATGQFAIRGVKKPPATQMRKLTWSTRLSDPARVFAESCPKKHSVVSNQGECIYWHFSSNLNMPDEYGTLAPQAWWKEFENSTNIWDSLIYSQATHRFQIGHATQMAWHTTNKVGCAYSICEKGTDKQNMVVVCRYHQPGNVEGQPIYEQGEVCSKCPNGYQNCPFGLCEKEV